MNDFFAAHTNMVAGVGTALFAVLVGTRWSEIGFRDYLIIVVLALLATAFAVERWMNNATSVTCALTGFAVGYLADDVYININATLPDFIKQVVGEGMQWLHNKIRTMLGLEPKDDDEDD